MLTGTHAGVLTRGGRADLVRVGGSEGGRELRAGGRALRKANGRPPCATRTVAHIPTRTRTHRHLLTHTHLGGKRAELGLRDLLCLDRRHEPANKQTSKLTSKQASKQANKQPHKGTSEGAILEFRAKERWTHSCASAQSANRPAKVAQQTNKHTRARARREQGRAGLFAAAHCWRAAASASLSSSCSETDKTARWVGGRKPAGSGLSQ